MYRSAFGVLLGVFVFCFSTAGLSPTDTCLTGVLLSELLCFDRDRALSISVTDNLRRSTCGLRSADPAPLVVDELPVEPLGAPEKPQNFHVNCKGEKYASRFDTYVTALTQNFRLLFHSSVSGKT